MSATSRCKMQRIDSTQSAVVVAAYGCQACAKIPQGSEDGGSIHKIETIRQ